jgi:hypothetical protein
MSVKTGCLNSPVYNLMHESRVHVGKDSMPMISCVV